jgi:hypothetical protein
MAYCLRSTQNKPGILRCPDNMRTHCNVCTLPQTGSSSTSPQIGASAIRHTISEDLRTTDSLRSPYRAAQCMSPPAPLASRRRPQDTMWGVPPQCRSTHSSSNLLCYTRPGALHSPASSTILPLRRLPHKSPTPLASPGLLSVSAAPAPRAHSSYFQLAPASMA